MEIKGVISIGRIESLTCCTEVQDLNIDNNSLYDWLYDTFGLESNTETPGEKAINIKYVILDYCPESNITFENLAAEVQIAMLYSDFVYGCYSEWTCGYGGFDWLVNDSRSIFQELFDKIGKYIYLVIE